MATRDRLAFAVLLTTSIVAAQARSAPMFVDFGAYRVTAASADGSVLAGNTDQLGGSVQAFVWTSGDGFVGLGDLPGGVFESAAGGVSADGSVVVGSSVSTSGRQAFRWTAGGGMVGIGELAGGAFSSEANAVSADGSVVVGSSVSTSGREAFRWTAGGGMVALGELAGGEFNATVAATSDDGAVIVGRSISGSGPEAFRWTLGGGMVGLGDLSGSGFTSAANDVTADGSLVVGYGTTTPPNPFFTSTTTEAFAWTSGGGMVGLGGLGVPYAIGSIATGASADGSLVVGSSLVGFSGFPGDPTHAVIWDPVNGMRLLMDVLVNEYGLDLSDWLRLDGVDGISADGRTLFGFGTRNDLGGSTGAWVVSLPEPSPLALLGLALALAVHARQRRVHAASRPGH